MVISDLWSHHSLLQGVKCNSAFSFPQCSQVGTGRYGRLHILHRHPLHRSMRVVVAARQQNENEWLGLFLAVKRPELGTFRGLEGQLKKPGNLNIEFYCREWPGTSASNIP